MSGWVTKNIYPFVKQKHWTENTINANKCKLSKVQMKSEEKNLEQLEEELTAKAATASSVLNRFSSKMRATLIESCPEKYLSTTTDGRNVENWHYINRDSKRLEEICRGKVPESSDLLRLLSEEVNLGL